MAEELTSEQQRQLQADLVALQASLVQMLEQSSDGDQPVDLEQPIGRLSRMDAIQQQKMRAANRRSSALRLQKVRAALALIERGEYGDCAECEEPIGFPRLRAQPESRLCLSCRRLSERAR